MYESHVKLTIIQAESQPDGIFVVDLEDENCDEVLGVDWRKCDPYNVRRNGGQVVVTNHEEEEHPYDARKTNIHMLSSLLMNLNITSFGHFIRLNASTPSV